MAIDERLRLSIHTKLTELIGPEEADALIAHIMPVPWHDVATKGDLRILRSDLDVLAAELRGEMSELRAQLRGEMSELRTEFRTDMADLRTEMHQGFTAQTRWLMGYLTALSAVMLTVARLVF